MNRLFVLWSAPPVGADEWMADSSGPCLVFDPLGLEPARRHGLEPALVDDLLDWDTRAGIELLVASQLAALRSRDEAYRLNGLSLLDAAEYELRFEWTALLCAHAAASALCDGIPIGEVVAGPETPSPILLGAAAAAGCLREGQTAPWRPMIPPPPPRRLLAPAAQAIVAARAAVSDHSAIRVLAVPSQLVAAALAPLDRGQARAAGLAVATFPGLTHGDPVRLVIRKGLPAFVPSTTWTPGPAPPPTALEVQDERLGAALQLAADRVLGACTPTVAAVARALGSLESLRNLRALVLPGTALGSARLLRSWAAARDLPVAVVQHGLYSFRDWDVGDRLADIIFGWGPAVAEQVALWPGRSPRLAVVGTAGVSAHHAPAAAGGRPLRVLVVSTTPSPGSALGLWGFHWAFLRTLRGGLQRLCDAGVTVELRGHPSEPWAGYRQILDELCLPRLRRAPAGSFARTVGRFDLAVCAPTSAAVEAATLGVPVLMWVGSMPLSVRQRFMTPPLGTELPGFFHTADDFDALMHDVAADRQGALAQAAALAGELARYGAPFEPHRMAQELQALAR